MGGFDEAFRDLLGDPNVDLEISELDMRRIVRRAEWRGRQPGAAAKIRASERQKKASR
jgi:hypothetical protein